MNTFAKTLCAAAVAMVGSTAMAQTGFYGQSGYGHTGYGQAGLRPAVHQHTAHCADGHCATGNCPTGFCATAECGHAGCTTGNCRYGDCADGMCNVPGHQHAAVNRPAMPRSAGPYAPTTSPYYAGSRPAASCPGGVCPVPQSNVYRPAYRQPVSTNACPNGNCRPVAVPQPHYQATRFNLLGLRF